MNYCKQQSNIAVRCLEVLLCISEAPVQNLTHPTSYLNRVYVLPASSSKHKLFHYFRLGLNASIKLLAIHLNPRK